MWMLALKILGPIVALGLFYGYAHHQGTVGEREKWQYKLDASNAGAIVDRDVRTLNLKLFAYLDKVKADAVLFNLRNQLVKLRDGKGSVVVEKLFPDVCKITGALVDAVNAAR